MWFRLVVNERPASTEGCPADGGWTRLEDECLRLGDGFDAEARATVTTQDARTIVEVHLEPPSDRTLESFTRTHEGRRNALLAKKRVITAPVVTQPIPDGRLWIEGPFDIPQAERMAKLINGS